MVGFVPRQAATVLDVGSANGGFGRELVGARPSVKVWGIDPTPGERPDCYESIFAGSYPQDLPPHLRFDCVVLNDVLEHLADPWSALRQTHGVLTAQGTVVASIPNVRHYRVVWPLVVRGRWTYQDAGILDRTHLRFFTASSIEDMFHSTGYTIDGPVPLRLPTEGKRGALRRLTTRFDPFLVEQYAVVARPTDQV